MLSARTKDTTSIPILKKLFRKIRKPEDATGLSEKEIEKMIYGVGFYRTKARYLKRTARILITEFNSEVPDSLEKLLLLPGVGRKTANIVLARAFGRHTLGVDVHVHRISNRLGLVKTEKPGETENKLMKTIPKRYIKKLNKTFVAYGQAVCTPVRPFCSSCRLRNICPRSGVKKSR